MGTDRMITITAIFKNSTKNVLKAMTIGDLWVLAKDPNSGVTVEVHKKIVKSVESMEFDSLD